MDVENKSKEYLECLESYSVEEYYEEDRKCLFIIDRFIVKINLDNVKYR